MTKLLVLDIDGTLVPDGAGEVPPENVAAIAAARRAGIAVTLATARKFRPACAIARQVGLQLPLICHGGAYVAHLDGAVISHTPLEAGYAQDVAAFADGQGHRLVVTVAERNLLAHHYHPEADAPFEDVVLTRSNLESLCGPVTRIATVDEAGSSAVYDQFCGDPRGQLARFYRDTVLYCVAAFHPQATKGNAVLALGAHLGVDPGDILAMGDMETDISMFRVAGRSVAMPHSPAAVKAAATVVAPAGRPAVAWAIDRLLCGETALV